MIQLLIDFKIYMGFTTEKVWPPYASSMIHDSKKPFLLNSGSFLLINCKYQQLVSCLTLNSSSNSMICFGMIYSKMDRHLDTQMYVFLGSLRSFEILKLINY
jgi:hypothetical protein